MANKEKKRKDKKRRQRRERKSKLPSSVEALLGYLGKTETTIASQGDTKPRERAGVDAYDTLHQIIKSQQMQNASYMANLERMAFKTEISEQLKKQGEESKKAITEASERTKAEVAQTVEKVARSYTKKSPEDKLKTVIGQMKFATRTPEESRNEEWNERYKLLEQKARKYRGDIEIEMSLFQNPPTATSMPTAPSMSVSRLSRSSSVPRGGGVVINQPLVISQPETTSAITLPALDPLQGLVLGGGAAAAPKTLTPSQEVQAGMELMTNAIDATSSSGTPAAAGRGRKTKHK
jgi:hypothetical protein